MLSDLLNQTLSVGIRTQTGEDDYGEPIYSIAETAVQGRLEFSNGIELKTGQDTLIATAVAYLPPETVISRRDRITYGGRSFEVEFVDEAFGLDSLHHKRVLLVEVK